MHDRHPGSGNRSGEQNSAYGRLGPRFAAAGVRKTEVRKQRGAPSRHPAPSVGRSGAFTLVTGGAGFIGSALVSRLSRAGERVLVLDDFSTGRRERVAGLPGVEVRTGDIRDPKAVRRALSGVDRVVHLAALASVPLSEETPAAAARTNVAGTVIVLREARRAGVASLVYASSCSVYGDGTSPFAESDPLRPGSVYAVTKLAGERHALLGHRTGGPPAVALRFFNVYGPGQPADSPYSGVLALFVAAAVSGARPTIHGDGAQTRDFVHVRDVVRAIRLALEAAPGPAGGRAFNVGSGRPVSILELWQRTAAQAGSRAAPRFGPTRAGDMRHAAARTGRAAEELGFRARVSLPQGIRSVLDRSVRGGKGRERVR